MYNKLKELVDRKGITFATFCRETGISQSVISNLKERGTNLSVENAVKAAKYFGVNVEDLICEKEHP